MDVSGKSDPYVNFFMDPPMLASRGRRDRAPRTSTRRQNLNPQWSDSDVPVMRIKALAPADLAAAHLLLVVMDRDVRTDDRMGQAILPLAAIATARLPQPFTLPVVKAGKQCGTLRGRALITWPLAAQASRRSGVRAVLSRGLSSRGSMGAATPTSGGAGTPTAAGGSGAAPGSDENGRTCCTVM
jgi:Ca2+-dependent lipid-binding protein